METQISLKLSDVHPQTTSSNPPTFIVPSGVIVYWIGSAITNQTFSVTNYYIYSLTHIVSNVWFLGQN